MPKPWPEKSRKLSEFGFVFAILSGYLAHETIDRAFTAFSMVHPVYVSAESGCILTWHFRGPGLEMEVGILEWPEMDDRLDPE